MCSAYGSSFDRLGDRGAGCGSSGVRRYFRTVFREMLRVLAMLRIGAPAPCNSSSCFTVLPPSMGDVVTSRPKQVGTVTLLGMGQFYSGDLGQLTTGADTIEKDIQYERQHPEVVRRIMTSGW
jgi:hypothetical protein